MSTLNATEETEENTEETHNIGRLLGEKNYHGQYIK